MAAEWQISAGELFELMRPVAWALSAIISALVFASARHRGFRAYAVVAWTLDALFFPLITLPLYLIVLALSHRRERATKASRQTKAGAKQPHKTFAAALAPAWKHVWPVLYLVLVLAVIAFLYQEDYWSLDAHLWRANNAKLRGPRAKVIEEYQAALRLEDDPHTHKLLAIEFAAEGSAREALAEFRAAERGGEPDDLIPYYMGTMLDALHRETEAAPEYKRFMDSPLCKQVLPDAKCTIARERVQAIALLESATQK